MFVFIKFRHLSSKLFYLHNLMQLNTLFNKVLLRRANEAGDIFVLYAKQTGVALQLSHSGQAAESPNNFIVAYFGQNELQRDSCAANNANLSPFSSSSLTT